MHTYRLSSLPARNVPFIYTAMALENANSFETLNHTVAETLRSTRNLNSFNLKKKWSCWTYRRHSPWIRNPLNFVNNFLMWIEIACWNERQEWPKEILMETNAIADDIIATREKINHHGKRADHNCKRHVATFKKKRWRHKRNQLMLLPCAMRILRLSYHGLRRQRQSFNADFKTDFLITPLVK